MNKTEVSSPWNFEHGTHNEVIQNDKMIPQTIFLAGQIRALLTVINKKYQLWQPSTIKIVAGDIAVLIISMSQTSLFLLETIIQAIMIPLINILPPKYKKSIGIRKILSDFIKKIVGRMMKYKKGMSDHGDGMSDHGDGMSDHGDGMSDHGDGMSDHGDGMSDHGDGMSDHGDGMSDHGDGMSDHGDGMSDNDKKKKTPKHQHHASARRNHKNDDEEKDKC
jgi:hypothetical protein